MNADETWSYNCYRALSFLVYNIKAPFHGFFVNGTIYMLSFVILVADQPWECTVYALKLCDSDMDCTLCTMQSRIRNVIEPQAHPMSSLPDDKGQPRSRRRKLVRNITAQFCRSRHRPCVSSITVSIQLCLALHAVYCNISTLELATIRRYFIAYISHEYPPPLSCFAVLGSHPWNLYRIISFHKIAHDGLRHHETVLWLGQHWSSVSVKSATAPSNIHCQWWLFLPSSLRSFICTPSVLSEPTGRSSRLFL